MAKKKIEQPPEIVVQAPPYIPRTPVSEAAKRATYEAVLRHWENLCDHYGATDTPWEDMPLHVQKRAQAILGAPDLEKTLEAEKRAKAAMLMNLLACWEKRRIPGPNKLETWEKLAKRAKALAQMLEAKNDDAGAARQWRRAEEYEAKAHVMRSETP